MKWQDDDDAWGAMTVADYGVLAVTAAIAGLVIGLLAHDALAGLLAAMTVPVAAFLYRYDRYVGRREP